MSRVLLIFFWIFVLHQFILMQSEYKDSSILLLLTQYYDYHECLRLSALPRIKIINCLVNLNIILMTPTATERVEQQCALVQIGVGTFTISLPELFENETEIAAQDASKTQPMVARHFKLADGGFWIKIRKDENVAPSIIQTEKSPAASRPFFHRADSNSSFTKNSTLNNSSSSVWACDRWAAATAATSSYSHAASLLLPMTMLFKCPSLQMSTKWEYEMFRTINGTIEEYIYEHTIDYPMLFDYQSIQQPSNAREGGHIDRHHEELHSNGLMIKISLTKHIEFNVDKDILDVIGLLIAVASGFSKKKKDEGNDLVVVRQTSSRRLLLGDYEDKRDPTLISLDRKPGRSLNCTFELHVSKIILRVQQRPLADMSSRLSSHHSFSFWYFNIISISYRLNLRFESSSEKEVVVTMDGTARKIALHKFVAAQPKQVLLSFESISGNDSSHILNQSYDPWDSKSSGSIRHNNTIEAAVHVFLWFEIPSASAISSSAENSNTTMHLSVLVGSVTATLSPVFLQELSETVIDAQRRLFELKQVEHHEEAHRQHYDTVLKKKSDQVVAGASSSERRTREIKLDRKELIIINYDVKIGNACILWDEKIQLKLECASIRGCKTHPDDENFQFFLKSLLDCITIEINRRPQRRESFLSLGSLPDGVRMLILLFVGDDTTALEQVLNIPPDTNRLMLMINLNQRLSLV